MADTCDPSTTNQSCVLDSFGNMRSNNDILNCDGSADELDIVQDLERGSACEIPFQCRRWLSDDLASHWIKPEPHLLIGEEGEQSIAQGADDLRETTKNELFDLYVEKGLHQADNLPCDSFKMRTIFGPACRNETKSSESFSRDHICDQARSIIARMRMFFRAYGKDIERLGREQVELFADPDDLTSRATGICIDTIRQCDDPVLKNTCSIAGNPVRKKRLLSYDDCSTSDNKAAVTQEKGKRGRRPRNASENKDEELSGIFKTKEAREIDWSPIEDCTVRRGRASKTTKRALKRDVDSVFGTRWSARIQQQAKVFYGIVQNRQALHRGPTKNGMCFEIDATPDRARSHLDDGSLRRSSERKRRPRRVFSPHPREIEKSLLLIGSVRWRLKFTLENPAHTSDGVLDCVRIDLEELNG
ncbi:hypothetical protein Aduo_008945 [Ancylostoma duodenale]